MRRLCSVRCSCPHSNPRPLRETGTKHPGGQRAGPQSAENRVRSTSANLSEGQDKTNPSGSSPHVRGGAGLRYPLPALKLLLASSPDGSEGRAKPPRWWTQASALLCDPWRPPPAQGPGLPRLSSTWAPRVLGTCRGLDLIVSQLLPYLSRAAVRASCRRWPWGQEVRACLLHHPVRFYFSSNVFQDLKNKYIHLRKRFKNIIKENECQNRTYDQE